jgi:16S rRNA (guanine527-N7)-methyltransferase
MDEGRKVLLAGLVSLGITVSEERIEQLLLFIELIEKWNKAFNLTAVKGKKALVRLHLLDSLAIASHVQGGRIVDVGTGAGLPGIPLAIVMSDKQFTLLDGNSKKTRFVQQVVLELKLNNVTVCHQRVESFRPEKLFDVIITRAFTNLSDMIDMTSHLLNEGGTLLAMKGKVSDSELAQISTSHAVELVAVDVPGVDAERCLIKIQFHEQAEVRCG